jgi:hypothetical protein
MLSFKKKTDTAGSQTPSWHPDFRDRDSLPDTKVVRTAFFINGIAVVIALSLLINFGLNELEIRSLSSEVGKWSQQIKRDQSMSNQAVAKFRKFQAEEKKLKEVADYIASRPSLANLITNIGRTLPENLAIDSFDLRANTLTLRATVRGAPDMASGYASNYVNVLREAPEFTDLFEKVSLTNLNRVADTGRLAIEVVVVISDPNKKGKK